MVDIGYASSVPEAVTICKLTFDASGIAGYDALKPISLFP